MEPSLPKTVTTLGGTGPLRFDRPVPTVPDHELLSRIGSGSYGEVWLARNIMGTYSAVKIVYRASFDNERPYDREFAGIKCYYPVSRTQENLVDILQVGRNDAEGYFYSVMELCDDINLGQDIDPEHYEPRTLGKELARRGRLPVEDCIQFTVALASGLGHLHRNKLIHRDIKPSNIIFVNGIPKIADIGLVTLEGSASLAGTEGFIPIEGPGTQQADIYSLGKVLYEMSSGKDRLRFPELPDQLEAGAEYDRLLELNEIILRACEQDVHRRYASTDPMLADLRLLHAGRSVRRLRTLERRLRLVARGGLIVAALAMLVSAGLYQSYRERTITRQSLARSYITQGAQSLDRRDLFEALPSFAEALSIDKFNARDRGRRIHWQVTLRQCPRLIQLWSTKGRINDAQFSPDGRRVAVASSSGQVLVYDIEHDAPLFQLVGHDPKQDVESVQFSPDGSRIVTGSSDATVRFWNATDGTLVTNYLITNNTPAADTLGVLGVRFSPQDQSLVLACADGTVRLMDRDGQQLVQRRVHQTTEAGRKNGLYDDAKYAEFSPDGRWIATGGLDGYANLLDAWTLEPAPFPTHRLSFGSWVFQASFSPDGRHLAAASYDKNIRILEIATGRTFDFEPEAPVRAIAFSPDGRYLAAALWDHEGTVRTWDLQSRNRKEAFTPLKHPSYVTTLTFSPDGHRLLTSAADGQIRLWELAVTESPPGTEPPVFDPLGNYAASMDGDTVILRSLKQPGAPPTLLHLGTPVRQILPAADGQHLLVLCSPGPSREATVCLAQLWAIDSPTNLSGLRPYPASITNAVLNRDGTRLLTRSDRTARVYDTVSGQPISPPLQHDVPVKIAALSRAGDRALTLAHREPPLPDDPYRLALWDTLSGRLLFSTNDVQSIGHLQFSPDGRVFAVSHDSGDLLPRATHVRDATTGQLAGPPLWHRDGIREAWFSADSSRLLTASEDRTAIIWDWATGRPLVPPFVHKHQVKAATFSPDDQWVATWDLDNQVRLWDAHSGMPISPSWRLGSEASLNPQQDVEFHIQGARFLAGSRQVAVWGRFLAPLPDAMLPQAWSHPTWHLWELTDDHRPVDDVLKITHLISGNRQPDGNIAPAPAGADGDPQRLWQRLRSTYPNDFSTSPGSVAEWYRRHARLAEEAGDGFAVRFNLEQLHRLEPDNAQVAEYLRRTPAAAN